MIEIGETVELFLQQKLIYFEKKELIFRCPIIVFLAFLILYSMVSLISIIKDVSLFSKTELSLFFLATLIDLLFKTIQKLLKFPITTEILRHSSYIFSN